jgi:uncharacterized protein YcfL
MKRWMLVVLVAMLGLQLVGCKAKTEVDDDDDGGSLKVDVDK